MPNTIENHFAEEAAKKMAEAIDFEVYTGILVQQCGWSKIVLSNLNSIATIEMNNWLHLECKHHWKHYNNTWVFENQEDAALFKLTWSN